MSNETRDSTGNQSAIVIAITIVICFLISGVVIIAVAIPDGGRAGSLIAILVAILAPSLGVIANLVKVGQVDSKVDKMLNGVMDKKIQDNVHTVLNERDTTAIVSPDSNTNPDAT